MNQERFNFYHLILEDFLLLRISPILPYETLGIDQMIIEPYPILLHRGELDKRQIWPVGHRFNFSIHSPFFGYQNMLDDYARGLTH